MLDITVLAAPIVELLRTIGSGQLPAGGPNAILTASSAAIETARTTARTTAAQMGQHWASTAADTAADQAHAVQERAQLVADNGTALAANLERAAAEVQRGMLDLANILEHFVTEIGPWVPTLLTSPAGLVLILESAAEHLRQALIVVERTRGELEDRKRELRELMGERIDQPPAEEPAAPAGAPAPATSPTNTTPATTGPAVEVPSTSETAPAPAPTGTAGGVLPGDGLTPEQYRNRPLVPGGPTPDPTGQPGVTGPIPPPGQQAPARPGPSSPTTTTPAPTTTSPAPTAPPTTTTPSVPTTAPPPARLPDQPGVIGPGAEVPDPPARLPDQPGVIAPPPES